MYDPEERFYIWQEYKEAVSQLFNDIDDDLCYRFAPCSKPEDKDAPNVKKLRDILEVAYDFTQEHLKELDEEYGIFDRERSNMQLYFNAWLYGLCPKVLKEFPFIWSGYFQNIAEFKKSQAVSQEDTRQAIELWRKKGEH